jgi:hypothetical protein
VPIQEWFRLKLTRSGLSILDSFPGPNPLSAQNELKALSESRVQCRPSNQNETARQTLSQGITTRDSIRNRLGRVSRPCLAADHQKKHSNAGKRKSGRGYDLEISVNPVFARRCGATNYFISCLCSAFPDGVSRISTAIFERGC